MIFTINNNIDNTTRNVIAIIIKTQHPAKK